MSEMANSEGSSIDVAKPVQDNIVVKFPPFPDPNDEDFDEDIGEDERNYYKNKFPDLETVKSLRLHCSACDRHLGSSTRNESRMRAHPMLRTLVCHTCHTFYNSGEFEKGDDGSELYCRWCGQGGQVYCCSDCPHVFCAKCIKRNLGTPKIKEIENTDDWKCFKCNTECLRDLRAICWALLRYSDLKNKMSYQTEDPELKEAYQKDCSVDYSECCKNKQSRRRERPVKIEIKTVKKEKEPDAAKKATVAEVLAKVPSIIQVKKFASINAEESKPTPKPKKVLKRSISPYKPKPIIMKNPIAVSTNQPMFTHINMPPLKKIRLPMNMNSTRVNQEKKTPSITYARIRPKPISSMPFNGFNSNAFNINDNINLSLESLTQGLDMAAVAAMSNNDSGQDDDVVCTPDFPLEPLCEVTEDNNDDDVQCITPGPVAAPKTNPLPAVPRTGSTLPEISSDNIIQMTDNDVTVNTLTGGLKFRVDPQTLSSNKMYRLPDGRIFAINANPSMPGGYSATIVAVTESFSGKPTVPKGAIYAAKLSAVSSVQSSTPTKQSNSNRSSRASKGNSSNKSKVTRGTDTASREYDMSVPVEWYRYNLIDAVDALEYPLSRLNKLKKEATTMYLRTRNVEEMQHLHKTLDRLLFTASSRFDEIRENLGKELKTYLTKKSAISSLQCSEDDDDVEILPNLDNDDPIFIDENSVDSSINEVNCNNSQEVDLTGVGSSDLNDSAEHQIEDISEIDKISQKTKDNNTRSPPPDNDNHILTAENDNRSQIGDSPNASVSTIDEPIDTVKTENEIMKDSWESDSRNNSEKVLEKNDKSDNKSDVTDTTQKDNDKDEKKDLLKNGDLNENAKEINEDQKDKEDNCDGEEKMDVSDNINNTDTASDSKTAASDINTAASDSELNEIKNTINKSTDEDESKMQETEFNEEMIESLLKDDIADDLQTALSDKIPNIVESV